MSKEILYIYTDGACRGNPGPGGWGAVMKYCDTVKEINGYEAHTTNNRMELTAAIEAISRVRRRSCHIHLTTDSKYLRDGITEWIDQWKKNGWKTANRRPVKNDDLWMTLGDLVEEYKIEWHWVKGHTGHLENERADALANQAIDELLAKGG